MIRDQRVIRFGRPEEVAELVAYMDSPAGAFLHGAIVELDGGATKGL
jgi:NAD(P)-dependent dehydrogenase (short-subunit alcohol dehydrogenase family)